MAIDTVSRGTHPSAARLCALRYGPARRSKPSSQASPRLGHASERRLSRPFLQRDEGSGGCGCACPANMRSLTNRVQHRVGLADDRKNSCRNFPSCGRAGDSASRPRSSRERLAALAGVSARTIYAIEIERVRPQRSTCRVLATALRIDVSDLSDQEPVASGLLAKEGADAAPPPQ